MIQITKEMRKQLDRQDRIEKCLSYICINTEPAMTPSGYITYVAVNSTTTTGRRYIVRIDESGDIPVAERCNCDATVRCVHMDSVDLYFQRIAAIFAKEEVAEPVVEKTVSLEVAMQEAQDEMVQIIEEAAIAGDATYDEVVTAIYDILGPTKKVLHAYGSCGHIVHIEDAGELCGPCRCK